MATNSEETSPTSVRFFVAKSPILSYGFALSIDDLNREGRDAELYQMEDMENEAIEFSSQRNESAITTQRTTSQSTEQVHKRLEPSNEEGPWNERRRTPRADSKTGVPW